MKRYLALLLCVCSLFVLPVTALAAQDDLSDWKEQYNFPEPRREDYADPADYVASYDAWYTGFITFCEMKTQKDPAETTPAKPIESAGAKNGDSVPPMDDNPPDKYPVGSYVDPAGVVWSPDGTRLSPLSAEASAQTPDQAEDAPVSSVDMGDPDGLPSDADPDTLAVIAGLVSDIATDSPTWYVEDLRSADTPPTVLDGLKALVTSIFGEYTPITTTSVVTETVGNDTHQYLVETVAPGAAGVDYEWLAGVALFGILLFCFMKLLGGILK